MNQRTPGIYPELTNDEYHSDDGAISKSGIPLILQSPAHYWAAYLDPDREPRKETKAFKIGGAGHKLILEPETFYDEFAVLPEKIDVLNGNTKIKKEYISALSEKGLTDLKRKEFEDLDKMAQRVFKHPEAAPLMTGGKAEQSFYWIDEDTGVLCKVRPDYWIKGVAIPDYKTTIDARPDKFAKSCGEYTYHIQAAFYSDGVYALTDEILDMPFVAQEKDSPFELNVFWISPDDVNLGRTQYKRALEIYARCIETDDWPGYSPQIKTISLPPWFRK